MIQESGLSPVQGRDSGHENAKTVERGAALQALRVKHPVFSVVTELIRLDDNAAVIRVEISMPDGLRVSSHGVAPADAVGSVEIAEDRALGRALSLLGIGDRESILPAKSHPVSERTEADKEESAPAVSERAAETVPVVPAGDVAETDGTQIVEDDPPLEDYSWTSFWQWARSLGYQNKIAVEEVIGQSITPLNPAQVRNLLRAKTGAA